MFSNFFKLVPVPIAGSILLLLLVVITYRDAPENGFHFDDSRNIYRYPPVMVTELTATNVIDAGRSALLSTRPLPSMSFAIDWARGAGSARPFQQTNIAIHGAAAVAVFGLFLVVFGQLRYPHWVTAVSAFIGAALWACHPIQVQAVTYIVQRMTSMAALFTILTVLLYLLGRLSPSTRRRWLFFGLAALCWILGLASKETAVIAPFLVLLVEYGVLRHGEPLLRNRADPLLLTLPAVLVLLVVIDMVSGAGPLSKIFLPGYELRDFTLSERLLTQPRVIGLHLSQIVWPLPGRFSLEHDVAVSTGMFAPPATFFALLGLLTWCGLGLWLLFRPAARIAGCLLLWLPATLVIESSIIPLELVFEHRMYLPSVGLAALAGLGIAGILRRLPRLSPFGLGACAMAIGLLMLATSSYVPVWKDDLSIARHLVKVAPNTARTWSTLARALHQRGEGWDKVSTAALRALALDPGNAVALNLRAMNLIEKRELDEAEKIIAALEPKSARDHSIINTIGMFRLAQGDLPSAVREFKRAVELNPFEPVFQYNLALSYELSGRCVDALKMWSSFLQVETNERRLALVRNRLQKNFVSEGGRCSDATG